MESPIITPSQVESSTLSSARTGRRRSGRPKANSYSDLMKPGESWGELADASERRKIQNRLAQRAYRRNMRDRAKEVELLKTEVKMLQQAVSTTTTSGNASESGERLASAPSHGSLSPGSRDSITEWELKNSTCLDKWSETVSQDHDMLGDCLTWPTDLDQDFGDCFQKVKEPTVTSNPISIPTCKVGSDSSTSDLSATMSTYTSSASAMNTMGWIESEVYETFKGHGLNDAINFSHSPSSPSMTATNSPALSPISSPIPGLDGQRKTLSGAAKPDRDLDADEPLIHIAIARGTFNTLRLLLKTYPISVNRRDRAGYTPLQRAVINGRTDMVALLIEHGADPGP
ncbi:hypothetical protein BGW36DRAFT_462834 [Talaromyces proteolyticus]|uniref:BZIP domain-containing protein n=1 Tax=Talaromyces proteolyticus TaxID=1131652 RepID=A0AAD4KSV0_9EURO|nr:uncharacterized protein BGW36DRAFT_462834 [Talaromyces proteolyticus]KAH8695210.1 hypothetical protein BGW36DRAFT_462834 [Talaromyces proteolyticus]